MKTKICFFGMLYLFSFQSFAQTEVEPNDSCGLANSITLGEAISGDISTIYDKDCFEVNLNESGLYIISIVQPIGAKFNVILSTSDGLTCDFNLVSKTIFAGAPFVVNISKPNIYYIKIEYKSSGIIPQNYTLKIEKYEADVYEFNNDKAHASPIQFGQDIYASIFGYTFNNSFSNKNDVDFYTFKVTEPGIVTLSLKDVPPNLGLLLKIYDQFDNYNYTSCPLSNGVGLDSVQFLICEPGIQYLEIADYYQLDGNFENPNLYHLKMDFSPDPTECNNTLATATNGDIGTVYSGTIGGIAPNLQANDYDYYLFVAKTSGNINFKLIDTLNTSQDLLLEFANLTKYGLWYNVSGKNGDEKINNLPVCAFDSIVLKISKYYAPKCTDKLAYFPYKFKLDIYSTDVHECNNAINVATKLNDIDTIYATLGYKKDIDMYEFNVNNGDSIFVKLSNFPVLSSLAPTFSILNSTGSVLPMTFKQFGISSADTFNFVYTKFTSSDKYFIKLANTSDSTFSNEVYKLIFRRKEKATATSDPHLENLTIYPNPATENLTVSLGNDAQAELKLYSITGELINKYSFYSTLTIPIKHLPKGLYIADILTSTWKVSKKVLIE